MRRRRRCTDLWAIIDGQIVIGEAKKSQLLERTDRCVSVVK